MPLDDHHQFQQLIDSMPQLVWTATPGGHCDFLNRQWLEYTGVPAEAQFGRGWLEVIHPDDRAAALNTWSEITASGGGFVNEIRIRRFDGTYHWFDNRAVPLHDATGEVTKWVGTNTDVTEQRRQSSLLQLAPVFVTDANGRIEFWGDGATRSYGYTTKEATGQDAYTLLHTEFPLPLEALLNELRRNGTWEGVIMQVTRDGARVSIRSRWLWCQRSATDAPRILRTGVDITQEVIAEAAARSAEYRLRTALEHGRVGTWVWDLQQRRLWWDHACLHLVGLTNADLPSNRIRDLAPFLHPDDRPAIDDAVARVSKTAPEFAVDTQFLRTDGRLQWLESRGLVEFGEDGRMTRVIGTSIDITERVLANRALQASRTEVRDYARQLDQNFEAERAHFAHELHDGLGQIMTGLKMDLAWIRRRLEVPHLPLDPAQLHTKLADANALIEEAIAMVRRVASDLRPPQLDECGLLLAIENHAQDFAKRAQLPCRLELAVSSPLDPTTRLVLFRVLQEALTNIARHSAASSVVISLQENSSVIELKIQDNGRGFSPTANGKGIGLSSMRERICSLDGTFEIQSAPATGTILVATVPLRRALE
jgi:PAS domain S-box-containing protein